MRPGPGLGAMPPRYEVLPMISSRVRAEACSYRGALDIMLAALKLSGLGLAIDDCHFPSVCSSLSRPVNTNPYSVFKSTDKVKGGFGVCLITPSTSNVPYIYYPCFLLAIGR